MYKKFKDYIVESIIDIPRKTFAPGVFDDANTNNPKIKSSVKKLIDDQLKIFSKEYPVLKTSLIGSILTKRYRNDADLDINVLFDVPADKQEEERVRLSKQYLSANNPDNIQGKEIPGTKHPINYYFITDKKTYEDQNKKADAVFDIENNKFIKRPEDFTFDVNMYLQDFNRKVQELDVVKGELKRDIIDYDELTELSPDDILDLQDKINEKLEEIEDSIKQIVKIGDNVDAERRAAFDKDMSPDEIRQYGVKNRLPKNVIYKMLEKYHYLKFYKKCKKILDDGEVTDAEIDSLKKENAEIPALLKPLNEAKSVAFTFGRFNPPTIGHEKLINKVKSLPVNDYKIFLSRSNDPKKNPLTPQQKLSYMKKMFPSHARNIQINTTNMVLDIATMLHNKGYKEISMVVGSDRVREFDTILNKYNDVKSRHGYYNFDKINVVSAGERDPDAEGAAGMSASKMRAAAAKDDFATFIKGLPGRFAKSKDAEDLFKYVRQGMRLVADVNVDAGAGALRFKPFITASTKEELDKMTLRDKYISEHLYEVGDIVDDVDNGITGVIIRRGTNYVTLEDVNMKFHRAWLYNIMETPVYPIELEERARQLKYDKETDQPKKYVAGLSDKEKKAHDRHLEKQGKKSDSDPSAYTQSPADKVAQTKPSKYTKRFKQMYGELNVNKEAVDIGHDWAMQNAKMTPGEPQYDPKYQGTTYKPSKSEDNLKQVSGKMITSMIKPVELKDIEEWVTSNITIDKYKGRYGNEWESKLQETYEKMVNKVIDTNDNIIESRFKEFARDFKTLNNEQFESKHNKSKEEIRKEIGEHMQVKSFKSFCINQSLTEEVTKAINYHLEKKVPISENIFRVHSQAFYEFYNVLREKVQKENIELNEEDKRILETDIGLFGEYLGDPVPLDCPMVDEEDEKDPPIGKPKRGGPKKFYVYVKKPDGGIKKVTWGDTTGLSVKLNDPEARKSFAARHKCDQQKDRTSAAYWACNTPRYAKALGLSGGGNFFW